MLHKLDWVLRVHPNETSNRTLRGLYVINIDQATTNETGKQAALRDGYFRWALSERIHGFVFDTGSSHVSLARRSGELAPSRDEHMPFLPGKSRVVAGRDEIDIRGLRL